MRILLAYHEDYFTLLPSISIGRKWIMLDWMFGCIEIQWGEFSET